MGPRTPDVPWYAAAVARPKGSGPALPWSQGQGADADASPWSPGWVHSGRALEFDFAVRTDDAQLAAAVRVGLAALPPAACDPRHTIDCRRPGASHRSWEVLADGVAVGSWFGRGGAFNQVVTLLNQGAIAHGGARLLLHSALVSRDGAGLLVIGRSGAGKSTLAAALLRRGFDYATDELVAVDARATVLEGLAKPLTLDSRARFAIQPAWLDVDPALQAAADAAEWQVPAASLGALVVPRATPDVVVLPEWRTGPATIRRLDPLDAIQAIVAGSVNFADGPGAHLATAAALAREVAAYRVVTAELREAVAGVLAIWEERLPPGGERTGACGDPIRPRAGFPTPRARTQGQPSGARRERSA